MVRVRRSSSQRWRRPGPGRGGQRRGVRVPRPRYGRRGRRRGHRLLLLEPAAGREQDRLRLGRGPGRPRPRRRRLGLRTAGGGARVQSLLGDGGGERRRQEGRGFEDLDPAQQQTAVHPGAASQSRRAVAVATVAFGATAVGATRAARPRHERLVRAQALRDLSRRSRAGLDAGRLQMVTNRWSETMMLKTSIYSLRQTSE